MNPELILALIQASRFALEVAERYGRGELTEEEARAEWARVRERVQGANALWERAGDERA